METTADCTECEKDKYRHYQSRKVISLHFERDVQEGGYYDTTEHYDKIILKLDCGHERYIDDFEHHHSF